MGGTASLKWLCVMGFEAIPKTCNDLRGEGVEEERYEGPLGRPDVPVKRRCCLLEGRAAGRPDVPVNEQAAYWKAEQWVDRLSQ